jgi:phosphoserine aminotransferase
LLRGADKADYVNTGAWSEKAISEARRYCEVNVVADAKPSHYTTIPDFADWQVSDDAAYLHYTPNETIHGVEFHDIPAMGKSPLIADMSSTILSRPVDVNRLA